MTDRELIELAAKAAGYVIQEYRADGSAWVYLVGEIPDDDGDYDGLFLWRPRADDGDALRLAVRLGLDILQFAVSGSVEASKVSFSDSALNVTCSVDYGADMYAATRRAIVRAAAEIGKAL